jgi:hypothetical protein
LNQQTISHTVTSDSVSEWHSGLCTRYVTCLRLSLDVGLQWTKKFSKLQSKPYHSKRALFSGRKIPRPFSIIPRWLNPVPYAKKKGRKKMTASSVCFWYQWFLVYIKTLPTFLKLQSLEAYLPNFAQDFTAVSSLSIRICSSLFYRYCLYQNGCVMVNFWGLVCRRYLARN